MNSNKRYLFRGVSKELHERNGGKLIPKTLRPFEYTFKYGEDKWGSGATYGTSDINAVVRHQLRQEGFPTSGISTTPIFDRAKFYATRGGKATSGYVYIIDRDLLLKHGVKEFVVSEHASQPSIPEDYEVILVAKDSGSIREQVIIDVKTVFNTLPH